VIFVVDLDAAAAPPAMDSVRQLLALIEGLPTESGELDWRLVSVSLNSPLRAELQAFRPGGEVISETHIAGVADAAFALLDVTNDNDPAKATRALGGDDRKRLRSLIQPMKDRTGAIQVIIPGRAERVVRAERAQSVLVALSQPSKRRPPELGSIEGQILAATTHYGSPALRIRQFLSDEEVLCVFDKKMAEQIGGAHTVAEVWTGRRVIVEGKITFDASGDPQLVQATAVRTLGNGPDVGAILDRMHSRGDDPFVEPWGDEP
jgi:hypothetical protein